MRLIRCALGALILALCAQAASAEVELYDLTFTITSEEGGLSLLPAQFGNLSVGATVDMTLCWNPTAPLLGDSSLRFAQAVCGYNLPLGLYAVINPDGSHAITNLTPGFGLGFLDYTPTHDLTGAPVDTWAVDSVQLHLDCASYGPVLPSNLADCNGSAPDGGIAIGPIAHMNGYPCTSDCGAGGSVFADMTSIKPVAVPEPGPIPLVLAALGCVALAARRSANSTRRSSRKLADALDRLDNARAGEADIAPV